MSKKFKLSSVEMLYSAQHDGVCYSERSEESNLKAR